MRVAVQSVLFRRLTNSNAAAFLGGNRGEYDLRYGRLSAVQEFTSGVEEMDPTALGGWTKILPIEPFDGIAPVPNVDLRLRYMGPNAGRAHDTYFASQLSDPYPLWAPKRARPGAATVDDLRDDVALVIKDKAGKFHARWVRREDIPGLPAALRQEILSKGTGVFVVPDTANEPDERVSAIIDALNRHHNVLLYGPPGTGKTHLVTEVRRRFAGGSMVLDTSLEQDALSANGAGDILDAWATFHQSYSYEDFLIGLRPEPLAGGGFDLVPRPGILLELAEWARQDGRSSLLVIDEINRGNVSRIFGEFITLMEPDKRLADDGSSTTQTVEVRLPFVDRSDAVTVEFETEQVAVPVPFTMPRRVFTLATMNSVDKSVSPLDAALRRRFHVINVSPQLDSFRSRLGLDNREITRSLVPKAPATAMDGRWLAISLLQVLNQRITVFLGPDFEFGEWFLQSVSVSTSTDEVLTALADTWRTSIMPQLEDYFVGRIDQLAEVLGNPADTERALLISEPEVSFVELGAVKSIRANPAASDDALLALMAHIARSGIASSEQESSSDQHDPVSDQESD